jgi:transcriptional regulator with XRE-family HTH domain
MELETAGQRIARARRRRGLSQAVLAGLVGRSESWLSQVERGRRVDSHAVLTRLAEVLRIDIEEITSPRDGDDDGRHAYPAAPLIEQALMRYGVPGDHADDGERQPGRQIGHLRAMARSAYQGYQATRYDATGRLLPRLIQGVETASRTEGVPRPSVCQVRALIYDIAAALLNRVGEPSLAWTAADRALTAAEYSGERVLAALAAWRLSYIINSRNHPREALDMARAMAGALEHFMRSPTPEQLSVYGALHLAAVTAAAAAFDRTMTTPLLEKARGIAGRTGETNHLGTAFGPVNVAIHAIGASLQLGDGRAAAEAGEALDLTAIPAALVGRRAQASLDLARAYTMRKQDAAAVNLLLVPDPAASPRRVSGTAVRSVN